MRTRLWGMTMIDVLIGSALFLIIFLALATVLRTSIILATTTKAEAGATMLLSSQMEYIRSLSYKHVALTTETPSGSIVPNATSTYAGISYVLATRITRVDDASDGLGASDLYGSDGDYKRVEISATYDAHGSRTQKIVGIITPTHIESAAGKGTLEVAVLTTQGLPVVGATVRVVSTQSVPALDITLFTNAQGVALLANALPGTAYQVFVSRSGYTSAQTELRTGTNAHPFKGVLSVEEGKTTKSTFIIDNLAQLTLRTVTSDLSPRANVGLVLRGTQTKGTSLSGAPLYTNELSVTTNAEGRVTLLVPYDIYRITTSGGGAVTANEELPFEILPGASATIDIVVP